MKRTLCKALATAAVTAGLALVSTPASAEFLDFTVHEGTVPGALDRSFEADKVLGGYTEVITFDGAGNFAATLVVDFTGYFSNEGNTPVASQLNVDGGVFTEEYGLYGVYTATGTVTDEGGGQFRFTTDNASAAIWIDPLLDTSKTLTVGGVAPIIAGDADDYLIMTASTIYFEDNVLRVGVGGFFDIRFSDPTLTAAGMEYWEMPTLNLRATVDGDFDDFELAGTQTISGEVSLVFEEQQVPEPASLALLGMGLLGTGIVARRRRRAVSQS